MVDKSVRVIPLYKDYIVMSAEPKFVKNGIKDDYNVKYYIPKTWSYSRSSNGELLVIWTAPKTKEEKLIIVDSGFHPVEVNTRGSESNPNTMEKVRFKGTNSAFLREDVELAPNNIE